MPGKVKLVKASELGMNSALAAQIRRKLKPFREWEEMASPETYLDARAGKYVRGLEMMLEEAVAVGDAEMARVLTLDLLKLTKLGHAKAEIALLGGVSKLRNEENFSAVNTEELRKLVGRGKDGSN